MQVQYLGKVAIAVLVGITLATGCSAAEAPTADSQAAADVAAAPSPDPCAGSNPCAGANGVVAVEATPAETQAIRYFSDENNIVIRGTDPVAYFTQGAPVAGSAEFTYTWNSATWQFASAENRDLFAANPDAYAPQYGGFCAWAVSQGYTAPIDPNAWKIVDGKLYLNYSQGVQRRWERDIPGNITKANANWPGVLSES